MKPEDQDLVQIADNKEEALEVSRNLGALPKDGISSSAVAELRSTRLKKIGVGLENAVYGSERWVVKHPVTFEYATAFQLQYSVVLLARKVIPRPLRPAALYASRISLRADSLALNCRTGALALLREFLTLAFLMAPGTLWAWLPAAKRIAWLRSKSDRGRALAKHLRGTGMVPAWFEIPPTELRVEGYPWRITALELFERADRDFGQEIKRLAGRQEWDLIRKRYSDFISLQKGLWRRGLFDYSLGIDHNYGMIGDRVVLVDFGELTDDPAMAREYFNRRVTEWRQRFIYTALEILPKEIADGIISDFMSALTHENVST